MVSQLTKYATKPKQCKKRTPNNYSWSHGLIMSANCNSKTCNNKAPGHKVEATKDNTMGGNLATKPKNNVPHQQGKTIVTIS